MRFLRGRLLCLFRSLRGTLCSVRFAYTALQGWHAHATFWSWSAAAALGFGSICGLAAHHAALAAAAWLISLADAQKASASSAWTKEFGGFDGKGGDDSDPLVALVDGLDRADDAPDDPDLVVAAAFWGDFFWVKFCAAVLPCVALLWLALRFVMLAHHVAHSVVGVSASKDAFA